jgi:hypothetical protein
LEIPTPTKKEAVETDDVYDVQVPEGQQAKSPPAAAAAQPAGPVCPACRNSCTEDAVICVHCGLDFRSGTKLTTTIGPKSFGKYSISRGPNDELTLTITEPRLFGEHKREFDLTGYDMVYYDTLDRFTQNLPPSAPDGAADPRVAVVDACAILASAGGLFVPQGDHFFYEVGLLGPDCEPIRLLQSADSPEVRELAKWLSDATGIRLERRNRCTS